MNTIQVLLISTAIFFMVGCNNNLNNEDAKQSNTIPTIVSIPVIDSTENKSNTADIIPPQNFDYSFKDNPQLKAKDFIKKYPSNQKTLLNTRMEELRKKWKNVPNPITLTYIGNDFGDYHHVLFKDSTGTIHDFGQANNNFGEYKLFEQSGQYEDNPKMKGKKFKVYWEWKVSKFLCCDGDYGEAIAYLPSITKLELFKKK